MTTYDVDDSPPSGSRTPHRTAHLPEGCGWGPLYSLTPAGQPEIYYPPSKTPGSNLTTAASSPRTSTLPDSATGGSSSGPTPSPVGRLIWVDFPPSSPSNPFHFSKRRKYAIVAVATYFTGITAYATSAYSIGVPSMTAELGNTALQAAAGLALYAWGFGIAPMVLAPLSEEYGRKWTYILAVMAFTILHLMLTLGKNIGTVLVGRFLIGACGSLGATLVGGTISDIYVPEDRGLPMAVFALMAMFFTGLGPIVMCWVEARPDLGWRWIQWIEMIAIGAYIPLVVFILTETRAPVIIRRRASQLRKERGLTDGGRYTARSEIGRQKFLAAMSTSLLRPLLFLCVEPIVTFFSVWISLAWGVFYTQIFGLPFLYPRVYGFTTTQTGLIYSTICIGSVLGFACNFIQDAIYRRKVAKYGVEARLYAPMTAGILLPLGCILYAFTIRPDIHWAVPSIGVIIIIGCVITLYITGFVYLSECYGSYASSALAGMSFLRNMFAGAFSMFTEDMYISLTPRWAIFLMGMVALLLGVVPFVAFWKGPEIRARSKYSKILMAEEAKRVAEAEKEDEERAQEMVDEEEWSSPEAAHVSEEKRYPRTGQGTEESNGGEEGERGRRYGL